MTDWDRFGNRPLQIIRTDTLPEGSFFVSPEGALYKVVMAGKAGFRKAELWPLTPLNANNLAQFPHSVALVPGSLLASNYPVIAIGRQLPALTIADFLNSNGQPSRFQFPDERLAKLAAQLDEALAPDSGLIARRGHLRWVLSDGKRIFRVYYHPPGYQQEVVNTLTPISGHDLRKVPLCKDGPPYWQYLPGWENISWDYLPVGEPASLPVPVRHKGDLNTETEIEAVQAVAMSSSLVPIVSVLPGIGSNLNSKPLDDKIDYLVEPGVVEEETQPVACENVVPIVGTAEVRSVVHNVQPDPESRLAVLKSSLRRRMPAMILSVDIGYGYTKVVGSDGIRFSFPSVIGSAEEIRFATDFINGNKTHVVEYDGARFLYGEQAVLQSRMQSTIFDRSRVHDGTYKLLFVAGLVELGRMVPDADRINLVTGLPVEFFDDREEVIKSLEGIYRIKTDHMMEFTVDSVFVVPQPFGSLFRELLNEYGKIADSQVEKGRIGVIDVGTYTTDFVVADELRYIQRLSGSARIGWSKVIRQVQQEVSDLYRLELSPNEVDKAIQSKEVKVRGRPVSLSPIVDPALLEVQTAIIARARDLWGEAANLDAILVSGGGGPYLHHAIRDVYSHARLLDNAFLANAEGFYRFGQRSATFDGE